MFKAQAPEGKTTKVRVFIKTGANTKRDAGELTVRFKPVTTADIDRLAEENAFASQVFDEMVEYVGPVGHPTETNDDGSPKPLPDDEALETIRNNFEVMQQVVNAFWDEHRADPKPKTSSKRRSRG